jgi:hypothetical protein
MFSRLRQGARTDARRQLSVGLPLVRFRSAVPLTAVASFHGFSHALRNARAPILPLIHRIRAPPTKESPRHDPGLSSKSGGRTNDKDPALGEFDRMCKGSRRDQIDSILPCDTLLHDPRC